MSALTRKTLLPFGSTGDTSKFGKFGSLAAGSPTTTKDIDTIQSLAAWLTGWSAATIASNRPSLQDMNSLFYVIVYELCYMFEKGVAEWDSATTYFIGSIVNDGTGVLYKSIQNNNLNHAVSDAAYWTSIVNTIGNYSGQVVGSTTTYAFRVSGVTTVPTVGATYTNNSKTFTVVSATASYVYATGTGTPQSSGTLTKAIGTGDATISFSISTGELPAMSARALLDNFGTKVQEGSFTAQGSFTISNLVAGKEYMLRFRYTQNTSNGFFTIRMNGDSGANYNYSAIDGSNAQAVGATSIAPYYGTYSVYAGGYCFGEFRTFTATNKMFLLGQAGYLYPTGGNFSCTNFSGQYNGAADVTSITITTSAGTMTGVWELFQLGA